MTAPGDRGGPRQPLGAVPGAGGVRYRVWAPDHGEMSVAIVGPAARIIRLAAAEDGYWTGTDPEGCAGDRYFYRFADGRQRPDAASRFQPEGVHGPSECIDPAAYRWRSDAWTRPGWSGQTIYELHIGTLTPAGTCRGAIDVLDRIAEVGAGALELMPVADFAGARNWGYDGVALYAPARCYGRPDDLRALVDAAHARGLAVILDVVYNHLGPEGCQAAAYAERYFRTDAGTPWGRGFAVEGPAARPVRDFLLGNAAYWMDEYRFDGLRLDATHAIRDDSPRPLLADLAALVHARGGFVIAEDERNCARLVRPEADGGLGLDALWADDFHHEVRVALTGTRSTYFAAYGGTPADLAAVLAHGWTYRGQPFAPWDGRPRGSDPASLPARAFVTCIENHDQVGNRPAGERLEHLVAPAQFRAASMLLCLAPYAPLIFMGQEWAASTPFLYFTNLGGPLGAAISAGRRREFERQGASWGDGAIPDPEDPATIAASRLRWEERDRAPHAGMLLLYRECLRERRRCLAGDALDRGRWEVRELGGFVAIHYAAAGAERLLLAALNSRARPLPGPVPSHPRPGWRVILHSEEPRFGGAGAPAGADVWTTAAPAAVWMEAMDPEPDHAAR